MNKHLVNLIAIVIVAITAIFFTSRASAQVDGWTEHHTAGITYTHMSFTDSIAYHRSNSGVFEYQGSSIIDTVWWTRHLKAFKFENPTFVGYTLWMASIPASYDGGMTVLLHHGDTTICVDASYRLYTGGEAFIATHLSSFIGTLDSVDAITLAFYYRPGTDTLNFTPMKAWIDFFTVGDDQIPANIKYDFGDGASIQGKVFADIDSNGVQGPGEWGVCHWLVKVYAVGDTVLTASAYTDALGNYSFPNLFQQDYVVVQEHRQFWTPTAPIPDTVMCSFTPTHTDTAVSFGNTGLNITRYPISRRWNLVSTPLAGSYFKDWVFPMSTSSAFKYADGYAIEDTLRHGVGYWLKMPADDYFYMVGVMADSVSISVSEGWNLIGTASVPVLAGSVTSDPPGMVTSDFFGYNGSYRHADTLVPGKGYWIKAASAGSIILNGTFPGALAKVSSGAIQRLLKDTPPPPPGENAEQPPRTVPSRFTLQQNYPNPFNPTTTIGYQIPKDGDVQLTVFNLLGQEVATLVDEFQVAGAHSIQWNAMNVPSGTYFYRLRSTGTITTNKMTVIK